MYLSELAAASQAVSATRSRKQKTELLAACLRRMHPNEIQLGVAYLMGLLPGGPVGLGPAAIRKLQGIAPSANTGLTLTDLQAALDALRDVAGQGANQRRHAILLQLLQRADGAEQSFVCRLLLGELRQGALEGVMVEAIASAARLPADAVRRAVMLAGDAAPVAHAALTAGEPGLRRFRLSLYDPVQPMLASPAASPAQALQGLACASFEYKLDGARVQIHKGPAGVRVYSRRLRDVTASVPEISTAIEALPVDELIVDGEVLVLSADGRPAAFQTTMRRFGRKLDVARMRRELPLSLFAFDCLHLAGEDLIDLPGKTRFEQLRHALPDKLLVPRLVTADLAEADAFLAAALAAGHEGVMAKSLEAIYAAGNRGAAWLKIKPVHTLDLVVLAAEWGSGRREGWLSNLHLGARDPAGGFVMLGKTFKGLTDELLVWQTEQLKARAIDHDGHVVYVRPELVVEIAFNELQASRRYPGGLALRFARVIRYRADKTAAEADSIDTVRAIYAGTAG